MMQIHVPSMARQDKITQGMIDDFIIDPVMSLKVIADWDLDAFQASRLRHLWWTPNLIDSSGFSTMKTGVLFLFCILRAILLGDQQIGVFYQSFDTGKRVFWPWLRRIMARPGARILRAQIGNVTEEGDESSKGEKKSGSVWVIRWKNDSEISMPAPNWYRNAENAAGIRLNVLCLDEWAKSMNTGTKGLEEQLIGRTSRECFNMHHPIWCNHRILTGTAENQQHPAWPVVRKREKKIAAGDPLNGHISYSYKDYSTLECQPGLSFQDRYRDEPLIREMRETFEQSNFMEEVLGLWSVLGEKVYTLEALQRCIEAGRAAGTEIQCVA